ncbi:MAG: hypothetical protein WC406_06225, partial [Methanoregula sp.]
MFTSESSPPEKNRLASSGSGANTRQDSSLKLLFCQNTHFKAEKTVQFSGVLRTPFFTNLIVRLSQKTPANRTIKPTKSITSENPETDRFIAGYCDLKSIFLLIWIIWKEISGIFFRAKKYFPDFFYHQHLP